ncbi:helix-turn-helix domain-containing protein [uncultured Kordia sp.]|uniref:helix-turn-helix domain-containing protein n=1 Tax=uncultured Kordia sp. TaxID=507699 RepID=UPI0026346F5B|nr:helix-turn-helix domain-containing protein [uncultured Kordia sp.]
MNFGSRFVFIFLFCCIKSLTAQQIDSLRTLSYQELKNQHRNLEYTNPSVAQKYAQALLLKAKQEGNDLEKNIAYLLNASSENYFGNMEASMQYIDSCISYAKTQKNSPLYIRALSQKGKTYYRFGKYTEATKNYLKFDSIATATENVRYLIYANQGIGSVKNIMGDHKGAVELFLKNKEIIAPIVEEKKYHTQYLNTLIALSSAYTYFDVDAAASYLPELKKISTDENDMDALSYYFSLQGIVNYKRKEYDKALTVFQKADSLVSLLGTKRSLYPIYRFRGKTYYEQQKFPEAIVTFEAIKTLQQEIEFDDFKYREVLSLLANSYEQIDSTKKALENYRLAHNLSYTDTIQESIRYTILKEYDKKTLEGKIASLEIKSTQKEQQNTSLWFVSVGLLLALLILLWIYKKQQHDNKKKFDELVQKLAAEPVKTEATESSQKFQISDEKITKILNGLQKFEKSEAFLHQNTSLVTVAKKLNTNTTYLSQIVNEQKGVTFKNYITELRINYVLHKLKNDKVLRSYSVKAIAKELGFKSEGAFSRAFKKQTGIYPSFFIKNLTSIS